jgi:hypothetical protein
MPSFGRNRATFGADTTDRITVRGDGGAERGSRPIRTICVRKSPAPRLMP